MNRTELRVKIDQKHFDIYNDFAEAGLTSQVHSLFFATMCVGYRQKKRVEPVRRVEKFWSHTFTSDEWACMYAVALMEWGRDFNRIQDDRAVIALMEEYSAGGMNYLIENQLQDLLLRGSDVPRLDLSACKAASQLFVYELWQMSEE